METIKINEVVHYHRTVRAGMQDGKLTMTRIDEIPCNPNRDEVVKTATTLETVNCPECISLVTSG